MIVGLSFRGGMSKEGRRRLLADPSLACKFEDFVLFVYARLAVTRANK